MEPPFALGAGAQAAILRPRRATGKGELKKGTDLFLGEEK